MVYSGESCVFGGSTPLILKKIFPAQLRRGCERRSECLHLGSEGALRDGRKGRIADKMECGVRVQKKIE